MGSIRKIAYEKYKLDWLMRHGYSLTDLIREVNSLQDEFISTKQAYLAFVNEYGFNGEIWSCYNEFLDNEYKDKEYIKSILNPQEFKLYIRGK